MWEARSSIGSVGDGSLDAAFRAKCLLGDRGGWGLVHAGETAYSSCRASSPSEEVACLVDAVESEGEDIHASSVESSSVEDRINTSLPPPTRSESSSRVGNEGEM